MKFLEAVKETGKIPLFDFEKECNEMLRMNLHGMPSARFLNKRKTKEIIKILREIKNNHNTSWYKELKSRADLEPEELALFYRGKRITFREMFSNADKMAKSLKKLGIEKGDEIACCISNTPELIYTMIAASRIGAKLNLFGINFEKDYLRQILQKTTNKIFIATDDNYGFIKDIVDEISYENKLLFSLADSLPYNPSLCLEYVPDLDKYYHYDNIAKIYKKDDSTIMLERDFFEYGTDYQGEVETEGRLDDEFLITYTSGSTRKGRPSQIIHSNSSLIISGYFNDLEISGSPRIPHQRGMCYIHSESNTNLVTCISDSLMKRWSVACEPEYDRHKALDVIRLNNPSMIEMTTTHLIQMAKDYLANLKKGIKYKFPNLIATFAVGEATSPGEEKLLNTVLRIARAGSEVVVKGIRLPFAPLSVGGGDCEHGGIFYNVFNAVQSKKDAIITGTKRNGMAPVAFSFTAVLKPGPNNTYTECGYDEYGILVANSATSMIGYKDDSEKTIKKIITDNYNRDWLSCDVYGYIDKAGKVHQKDRVGSELYLSNSRVILPSEISDCVLSDSKNILSCTITVNHLDNGDIPIINFELSPLMTKSRAEAIISMRERLINKFGKELTDSFLYREFNDNYPLPEAVSGKRDVKEIENISLENTFWVFDTGMVKYNVDEGQYVKRI